MPPKRRASTKRSTTAATTAEEPQMVTRSMTRTTSVSNTAASGSRKRSASVSKKKRHSTTNPTTEHYEFGGPLGAAVMVTVLPAVVLLFAYGCDDLGYTPFHRFYAFMQDIIHGRFESEMLWSMIKSWDPMSLLWYLAFVGQLVTFSIALPGEEIDGAVLRNGNRLTYKINGLTTLQAASTMLLMSNRGQGLRLPLWIAENFENLATASVVISFVFAIAAYLWSFQGEKLLAEGGNTGNPLYDFMVGRELNPRIGQFDIKFFTELRPGLAGWLLINICMAVKQWQSIGRITNSMALVVAFQSWYILDALWHESSVLTTMDITKDGFGFMLAFGNLCWVPAMYSLQARYLSDFPVDLNMIQVAAVVVLQCAGYYVFRSANSQKDKFRKDPHHESVRDLKTITTTSGTHLLTSGWWGKARHINYLGDWLMSLSWCLACGFDSVVPYFYTVYFLILLLHRERRDNDKCQQKYGKDWQRYCSAVEYRIVPGIY